jgi:hypothetical protein
MEKALIKLPNWGSGFFSNYFCVISMLYEVDELGYEPYIDLSNTAFVEGYNPYKDKCPPKNLKNPWEFWFHQNPIQNTTNLIKINYSNNRFNVNRKIWGVDEIVHARHLKDKYIKIHNHILDSVQSYYKQNFENKVVLGVMARGTEMNKIHPEYGNQSIQDYINQTKKVLAKEKNIDVIFVVSEDLTYIKEFEKHFSNVFYVKNVFRRTNETLDYTVKYPLWPCLDESRENHCKLLGDEMLMQALLLGKCDYLIAKVCGTASAAIFFSEKIKKVYYVETSLLFNPFLSIKHKLYYFFNNLFYSLSKKF